MINNTKPDYRPDIDGLRAIAVVAVILYHAGVEWFSGGFVGVDIFFVISGYLISSLIINQMTKGTFSYSGFFIRRLRRIVPALSVVVVFSLIASWFIFLPSDYRELGQSAFAQSVFSSNIYFLREIGYFASTTETKPLLHTWSLAVEEQFYILFPFLLVALSARANQMRIAVLGCLAAASFVFAGLISETNQYAAFYLLPARAWEFLLGVLIALVFQSRASIDAKPKWQDEIIGWVGFLLILYAIVFFDKNTRYLAAAVLIPCTGGVAIIWSNRHASTSLCKLLSWYPFVWVGLISYSLYLWHWPLLALAKYMSIDELSLTYKLAICIICVPLAWGSYKWVETPVRTGGFLKNPNHLAGAAAVVSLAIAIGGLSINFADGFPARVPVEAQQYADATLNQSKLHIKCQTLSLDQISRDELCRLGDTSADSIPQLIVLGDSHAVAILSMLDALAEEYKVPTWHAVGPGCLAPFRIGKPCKGSNQSSISNQALIELIERNNIKSVFISSKWNGLVCRENTQECDRSNQQLRESIFQFTSAMKDIDVTIWILEQVPGYNFNIPRRLYKETLRYGAEKVSNTIGKPYAEHKRQQTFMHDLFVEALEGKNGYLLDPGELLCRKNLFCITEANGLPLYYDTNHLTTFGAQHLRPLLETIFQSLSADRLNDEIETTSTGGTGR